MSVDYAIRYTSAGGNELLLAGDEAGGCQTLDRAARFDRRSDAYRCIERVLDGGLFDDSKVFRVVRIRKTRSTKRRALKDAARAFAEANATYMAALDEFWKRHGYERSAQEEHAAEWEAIPFAAMQLAKDAMCNAAMAYAGKEKSR